MAAPPVSRDYWFHTGVRQDARAAAVIFLMHLMGMLGEAGLE